MPYEILESGRPHQSTDSVLVYDGDPATSWRAGAASPEAYVWLDLGEVRLVSGLRWFQPVVDGPVAIQTSDDRETWTTVVAEERPEAGIWQEVAIGERARFVRIVVGNQNQAAELAEVQILGTPGSEPADTAIAEMAPRQEGVRPPNVTITGGGERGRQAAAETVVVTPEADAEAVEITVNGQAATCRGGERCRVETPRPDVVEDCGDGTTTCTIRISNAGGLAMCDVAGGDGRRNRENGGNCAADASGGTVTVSDVDR
ncbi:MAG: discoidin domain-containing protein [Chloroflexota bacterium]|nr:discoidin domain-containing protein [Chloroflexota bacterium]